MQSSNFVNSEQDIIAYFMHFCVLEWVSLHHRKKSRKWLGLCPDNTGGTYDPDPQVGWGRGKLPLWGTYDPDPQVGWGTGKPTPQIQPPQYFLEVGTYQNITTALPHLAYKRVHLCWKFWYHCMVRL